jgi:hypothetical protein
MGCYKPTSTSTYCAKLHTSDGGAVIKDIMWIFFKSPNWFIGVDIFGKLVLQNNKMRKIKRHEILETETFPFYVLINFPFFTVCFFIQI